MLKYAYLLGAKLALLDASSVEASPPGADSVATMIQLLGQGVEDNSSSEKEEDTESADDVDTSTPSWGAPIQINNP